jgi:hypothetical protein
MASSIRLRLMPRSCPAPVLPAACRSSSAEVRTESSVTSINEQTCERMRASSAQRKRNPILILVWPLRIPTLFRLAQCAAT